MASPVGLTLNGAKLPPEGPLQHRRHVAASRAAEESDWWRRRAKNCSNHKL